MRTLSLFLLKFFFFIACAIIQTQSLAQGTTITKWKDDKQTAISITYDDATINQFRQALLIMDTLGFKGTFFINTGDIPGSRFLPKYFGKPLDEIVKESAEIATNKGNLFERASAVRFLNVAGAVEMHNSAGSHYENKMYDKCYTVIDSALALARKNKTIVETRPVLLTGEVITWDELRGFAKRGHEFGNHTISHPRLSVLTEANLRYELEMCKEEIGTQLGKDHVFSAECPFGTEDARVMEYAYKIHPALRNRMPAPFLEEINRWSPKTPGQSDQTYVQWQRGPLQKTSPAEMNAWVDTLLNHDNTWLVLTFHGVDGVGWEAKPHEELRNYFGYIKEHEDSVWVDTFGNVTRYIRERMNTSIDEKREAESITVTLKHSLDKTLYDDPLTLKTYIDPDWESIEISQGGRDVIFKKLSDDNGDYVVYDAMVNGASVVLKML